MRTYSVEDYQNNFKRIFNFLTEEYGFSVLREVEDKFLYKTEYQKFFRNLNDVIRIYFSYDWYDESFSFFLIKGAKTVYPNYQDKKNIISFCCFFQRFDSSVTFEKLFPDDNQYIQSLELNATLLKKYGDRVLRGLEWI